MSTYQLLYQSYSLIPFEPRELDALLASARTRNQQRGLNSILLYTPDGRFLQLLEGAREAVRELYNQHLVHDPRHYHCQVLSEGPSEVASFAGCPMEFFPAQAQDLRRLLAPVPVPGAALLVPRPHTRPELVELLLEFMRHGEPVGL
ncbi:BLUF domain-containing protein [Hymenobacter sp. DH14]|uniref:BLUF domain-containing protein n=1 Tax=Hymenobacter cyanobacteriorum TaxID=2926463 RepID=A0A9X1VBD3_9BACT|nr:BLUF domain-containing protein [Hymenobacter cyanobacteriorum]MCI1185974.1 BLUF domain-containing protein [Hymenobacter cyanobacteriorum]